MGQSMARVTGGIEKRDINPDYQRFADSPKDKLLGKSSLVHVIGESYEFCWLCADQVLVSFARYQTISHGLNALLVNNMLQPPSCWVLLLGRQSGGEGWVSLWRQENMGGGLSIDREIPRDSREDFCIVKEVSGGSVTPWEEQVVGWWIPKTPIHHHPPNG